MDNKDFVIDRSGCLKEYNGDSDTVIIPEGVISIGSDVFQNCENEHIKKIVFPASLKKIPDGLFDGYNSIQEVIIQKGTEIIGCDAFSDTIIEQIQLPETVTTVMPGAFQSCDKLREIHLPRHLQKIGADAFSGCIALKTIVIPDGVKKIEADTFSFSGLESINLPDSLDEIGSGAFSYCHDLKKITGPALDSLKIGKDAFQECDGLTGESGVLMQGKRVLTSDTKKDKIVIPDGCESVDANAFEDCRGEIEMSIHCPRWKTSGEAKTYASAYSIIGIDGAMISLRDQTGKVIARIILAIKDETEPKSNAFILAIRSNKNGEFDFAGYDSMFTVISKPENKLRMAAVRMQYPYMLSDEFRNLYLSYLKRYSVKAGMLAIERKDISLLGFLCDLAIFNEKAAEQLTTYASEHEMLEVTAMLLDYKKEHFKTSSMPSLGKMDDKSSKRSMKVSDWRKIYDFKYKNGCVLITGYHGNDSVVTFPEKIGDKYVIGIGNYASYSFYVDSSVSKIIVPGWFSILEPYSLGHIYHTVEIDIQEGITELNLDAFLPDEHSEGFTVKLPESLSHPTGNFGEFKEINWQLIADSPAEQYFKEHHYRYSLTKPYTPEENKKKAEEIRKKIAVAQSAASPKHVDPWKKPKAGTHLISRYHGNEENVVFPEQVGGIKINGIAGTAGSAPEYYKHIRTITIPEGYQTIGAKAFSGCENLEYITLPTTIREIGSQAFEGCTHLKELYLAKEISFSGHNTFNGAVINTLVLESPEKKYPSKLFAGAKVTNLLVLGNLKSNVRLFDTPPEGIYTNGSFVIYDMHNYKGWYKKKFHTVSDFDASIITDPQLKQRIAQEQKTSQAAANINSVKAETVNSIVFSDSHFFVMEFLEMDKKDREMISLVESRISSAGGIIENRFGKDVDYLIIPDYEFIENAITKKAMHPGKQGKHVAIIKASECLKHADDYFENLFGTDNYRSISNYEFSIYEQKIYLWKYIGKEKEIQVPDRIEGYSVFLRAAFTDNIDICKVELSEGIEEIPECAFARCTELTSIKLNEGLRRIGDNAFDYCTKMTDVSIPSTVEYIGSDVFDGCWSIRSICIPASTDSIHAPLTERDQFVSITVDPANPVYDSRENCNAVIETKTNKLIAGCRNTVIPADVISIGESAFKSCSIQKIEIPEGVIEIGEGAFYGCSSLENISLPSSIRVIHPAAFLASGVKNIVLPEGMTDFDARAFRGCSKLTEITIPDSLKKIDNLNVLADTYNYGGTIVKKVYGSKNSIAKQMADELKCEYIEIKEQPESTAAAEAN